MIFLTSDLHIGHANAALNFRGFGSVQAHDDFIIDRINDTCGTSDTLFILGDAVMGQFDVNVHRLADIRADVHLVPGNHDRIHACCGDKPARRDRARQGFIDAGVTIHPDQIVLAPGVIACHFPFDGDHGDEDRYPEHRPIDDGASILLHGHLHDSRHVSGRQVNVGVDVNDFRPITLDHTISLAVV